MASPHPSPSTIPSPLKFQALSQPYHTILFDCDGVFYRGSNAIPGAFDALRYLRSHAP